MAHEIPRIPSRTGYPAAMFLRPTLVLLGLVLAVVAALFAYDRSSDCDTGPIERGIKDLFDEPYSRYCR